MLEVDAAQIINSLITGGAIYAGIRVEIKFIWVAITELKAAIVELRNSFNKVDKDIDDIKIQLVQCVKKE